MTIRTKPDDRSPAVIALGNAVWAVVVCTTINLLCSWGVDTINAWVGNPPVKKAPTWIGSLIVGGQTGWPVLVLAVLCGLFGRDLSGLNPTLCVVYFLGLLDPIAALVVGIVLVMIQRREEQE